MSVLLAVVLSVSVVVVLLLNVVVSVMGGVLFELVEVVVAAEERFGVKIPDEAVTDLVTVGDAVNFIVNAAN